MYVNQNRISAFCSQILIFKDIDSTMRHLVKTAITLALASGISACGDTGVVVDGQNSAPADDAVIFSFTDVGEPVDVQARIRSPQGIPNDGDDRRNHARESRIEGRLPDNNDDKAQEDRSYDGAGNNVANIEWGATFSNLQRLGDAGYSDGISSMVFTDRAGAREISNTIVSQAPDENIPNAYGTTDYAWQWGQFIDHDIDLTDGSADEPQGIEVPIGDPYFDPALTGTVVIPFNRALYDPDTGTDRRNVRQQENEITSWMDGSMVYGSSDERAAELRQGDNSPLLATSTGNFLPFNVNELTNANGPVADPASLFLAGDIRANEQVGLTALHTLFVREHNRVAIQLRQADPDASAETIFQAARRLVVAQIQIITYDEHLPALLGANAIPQYRGYDASINPTIYNEFSASAYRLGHSMVSDQILRIGADGQSVDEGPLTLSMAFFSSPELLQTDEDLEAVLRGLGTQIHQTIDVKVIHTLRNLLFGAPGSGGLDLTALNIQRGRDHGLPSYNDMRIVMGLRPVSSFEEITDDIQLQQSLRDAYGDISKIDLWVGGLAEAPLSEQGSQLGELFQAIIVKQFVDLRDGDRFWYENYLTQDELDFVSGVTLARVIRDNTSIGSELQDNVFYAR